MHLETPRLNLIFLQKDAVPMVLSFYEDNKNIFEQWEPKRFATFYTLSYQKASLTSEHYQMLEGKLLRYWVFLMDHPNEIVGTVCFQNFRKAPYYSCSLGYKLSEKYWHQGYAYEAIQTAIQYVFKEKQIHRIEAFIMPNNIPSIRLIERLQFRYEGLSFSYANINGSWEDHKRYSLINPNKVSSPTYSNITED